MAQKKCLWNLMINKMTNKIAGLKLEEIIKFNSKKFKSCIVRYNGECGGNSFEKEKTVGRSVVNAFLRSF